MQGTCGDRQTDEYQRSSTKRRRRRAGGGGGGGGATAADAGGKQCVDPKVHWILDEHLCIECPGDCQLAKDAHWILNTIYQEIEPNGIGKGTSGISFPVDYLSADTLREYLPGLSHYAQVATLPTYVGFRGEDLQVAAVGVGTNQKLRERALKLALALSLCLKGHVDINWAKERTSSAFFELLEVCK